MRQMHKNIQRGAGMFAGLQLLEGILQAAVELT